MDGWTGNRRRLRWRAKERSYASLGLLLPVACGPADFLKFPSWYRPPRGLKKETRAGGTGVLGLSRNENRTVGKFELRKSRHVTRSFVS
eukprot:661191-Prorocentrum_minimum.AAC.2